MAQLPHCKRAVRKHHEIPGDVSERVLIFAHCTTGIPELDSHLDSLHLNLDELNHLAHLLAGMSAEEQVLFRAAMESGYYDHSMAEIINAAQSTQHFELHPIPSDDAAFGMMMAVWDAQDLEYILYWMIDSDDPEYQVFAEYVEHLQKSIDPLQYERLTVTGEDGVRTSQGLFLVKSGPLSVTYTGPEDIPAEHRVTAPAKARESLLGALESLRALEPEKPSPAKDSDRDCR